MVLLTVELVLLRLGQVTIVLRHISLFFVLDMVFASFQVRGFTRTERAVLNAARNSLLLILCPAIYFVNAGMARINYSRTGA